jgi:hypothetical protein
VLHRLVGGSDARGALGVYLGVGALASEVDSVVAGVLLGDGDESGVGPGRTRDCRSTLERRKASARIPSFSVSGLSTQAS